MCLANIWTTTRMDFGRLIHGINWFLFCLVLAVLISRGTVAEDGQNKTVSGGFPSFKSIANSFSKTVDSFFKKTLSIFKHHPDNTTSSESNTTNTVTSTTVQPTNITLSDRGPVGENPEKTENNGTSDTTKIPEKLPNGVQLEPTN